MSIHQVSIAGDELRLTERLKLWNALQLDEKTTKIISITGAGGKTSVMYRLAEELKELGRRVIITTSTHIQYPENVQTVLLEQASQLGKISWGSRILAAGGSVKEARLPVSGLSCRKLGAMNPAEIAGLADWCDVLLIEADGSRRLPLKVPAGHEPVIIPETDAVIGCAGLTCIGKTWEEGCFRPEPARELLRKAGYVTESTIRPEDAAHILTDQNGTRKQVENRPYRIVLNQADGERELGLARQTAREISRISQVPVVITSKLI